jgi:hypothetical protein
MSFSLEISWYLLQQNHFLLLNSTVSILIFILKIYFNILCLSCIWNANSSALNKFGKIWSSFFEIVLKKITIRLQFYLSLRPKKKQKYSQKRKLLNTKYENRPSDKQVVRGFIIFKFLLKYSIHLLKKSALRKMWLMRLMWKDFRVNWFSHYSHNGHISWKIVSSLALSFKLQGRVNLKSESWIKFIFLWVRLN